MHYIKTNNQISNQSSVFECWHVKYAQSFGIRERVVKPGSRFVNERCTFSISLIKYKCDGDHTGEVYSKSGLTYVINARLRLTVSLVKKLLKISADRNLALDTKSWI